MTVRKVFGPGWMCQTGDNSKDDYRFSSSRTLPSGTNSLSHSFIHSLTHSVLFKYILRPHSRRHFKGTCNFSRRKKKKSIRKIEEREKEKHRMRINIYWIYIIAFANIFNRLLCATHEALCASKSLGHLIKITPLVVIIIIIVRRWNNATVLTWLELTVRILILVRSA